jgi:Metallo-beta-lactamase superfamily
MSRWADFEELYAVKFIAGGNMDSLWALPVKGEAFFLFRQDRSVLVDGGWNGRALASAIIAHDPCQCKIDIVVCTHADKDHAGGLATFLKYWQIVAPNGAKVQGKIGQFWLPGRWIDILPRLMRDPRDFCHQLISDLDKFVNDNPRLAKIEVNEEDSSSVFEAILNKEKTSSNNAERDHVRKQDKHDINFDDEINLGTTEIIGEPQWLEEIRKQFDDGIGSQSEAVKAFRSSQQSVLYRRQAQKIGPALAKFWLSLITTAKIIRGIAEAAIKYKIRIRWFDFEEFAKTRVARGGVPDFLVPLNAVEQSPPPGTVLNFAASLSPINEESLAFIAPPTFKRLGVVFCGDSPLGDGNGYNTSFFLNLLPPKLPVIATAPHHGSESNKVAYSHLNQWASVMIWLRTGGSKKQPGKTFKNFGFPERICTHCKQRNPNYGLQKAGVGGVLKFPVFGPIWIMGHKCDCS